MLDSYNVYAWYIPSMILVLPIYLLLNIYNIDVNSVLSVANQVAFEWDGVNISVSIVLWFLLAKIIRFIGKHAVENRYFDKGKKFPTTVYLTRNSNELSETKKDMIFELVNDDFGFNTSNVRQFNENDELIEVRDYVSSIRRKVGKGTLTFELNRRYGFIRNFIGGLYIVFPILFCNFFYMIYLDKAGLVVNTLYGVTILFGLILIFQKYIVEKFADEYSHMLFDDYINLQRS